MNDAAPCLTIAVTIGVDWGLMKIEHEFWMERSTHAVWAVELTDNVVTACYGPLLPGDIEDDLLDAFDYAKGGAEWIELNRDRFGAITPAVPEITGT